MTTVTKNPFYAMRVHGFMSDGPGFAGVVTILLRGRDLYLVAQDKAGIHTTHAVLKNAPTKVAALRIVLAKERDEVWKQLDEEGRDYFMEPRLIDEDRHFWIEEEGGQQWMLSIGGSIASVNMTRCSTEETGPDVETVEMVSDAAARELDLSAVQVFAPAGSWIAVAPNVVRLVADVEPREEGALPTARIVTKVLLDKTGQFTPLITIDGMCRPW